MEPRGAELGAGLAHAQRLVARGELDLRRADGDLLVGFERKRGARAHLEIARDHAALAGPRVVLEEDLAAVTDIAAGGTVELLTMIKNTYGIIPSFAVEVPDLPTRTELFWEWFQDQSTNLKKIGCVFEQQAKSLRVKTWR